MECPSCHGTIDVAGVFPGAVVACPACGTKARASAPSQAKAKPIEAPVALTPTKCPCCPSELVLRHHDAHVVSVCPDGHGLFATRATLKEIQKVAAPSVVAAALDETSSVIAAAEDATTRLCPRCRAPMTRRAGSSQNMDVVVDTCAEHGTWFDAGELRELLDARARSVANADAEHPEVAQQAKATLDVALALEAAREKDTMRRGVEVAEDILDVLFGRPYRRRRGFF